MPFFDTPFHGFVSLPPHAQCGVLIVHGLADYSARFERVSKDFAARQVASFAFDLAGHGNYPRLEEDPRNRTHVERFDVFVNECVTAWDAVRKHHPDLPLFIWGHSMGAVVAILAVARGLGGLRGVITSSPPLDVFSGSYRLLVPLVRALAAVVPRKRMSVAIKGEQLSTVQSVGAAYARDPQVPSTASIRLLSELARACDRALEVAPELHQPWLLLHGTADTVAPHSGSERLVAALGSEDKRLVSYRELRHELQNEREPERTQLIDLCCDWMKARRGVSV